MTSESTPLVDRDERVDVLLVDDRAEDLVAMTTILEGPLYNIVTARSGPEALKRLLEQDFAVILLDVLMPSMDGFELASMIKKRERSKDIPLIFLTAAGSDITKIYRGYELGAVDYLPKPVDPDVVRAKVAIFAELFRRARRLDAQGRALREAERRERELQITELKLAAERRFTNLAEAIPEIVWTAGPAGDLVYANRRFVEYTGMDLDAARGDGWLSAVHPEDVAQCISAWREAVARGTVYEGEFRLRRGSDEVYRWHLGRAVPERSSEGEILAWLGTHTDFEDLKQAIRARDEFLSIASHELRTPLTALKLRLQALLYAKGLDEKLERKLESAARQTQRLERLIDNLLDISRITTGHLELEPEELELAELVHDVVERLRDEAAGMGSQIQFEAASPAAGRWDRLRIEQVVTNLLSNALKYGEGHPISVRVSASDGSAEVSVRDRGMGIAEPDLERIFDRFERAANRRAPGGLGMGLYITRQIVEAHRGSIHVESRTGEGSLFRVELPRVSSAS
ncbi:MAG TPA: ATP-binding protein [Polyangiaceae bacterium]